MKLDAWWHVMRPRCAPYGDVRPLAPRALGELPAEVCAYFDLLGPRSWFGHRVAMDFLLLSAAAVDELREAYAENMRGWLPFASRGDRTGWFLSPVDGTVAETYDDSPWYAGPDESDVRSFATWRAQVTALRKHTPGTATLIALTEEERVFLDGALSSAEPRDILIFARDLEYRVTPDAAWSHRRGEPDRMLAIADWALLAAIQPSTIFAGDGTSIALLSPPQLADFDRTRGLCATASRLDGALLLVADVIDDDVLDDERRADEADSLARGDPWAAWSDDD